jgi:hypothetical protein
MLYPVTCRYWLCQLCPKLEFTTENISAVFTFYNIFLKLVGIVPVFCPNTTEKVVWQVCKADDVKTKIIAFP